MTIYKCSECNYTATTKFAYSKHISTQKHIQKVNVYPNCPKRLVNGQCELEKVKNEERVISDDINTKEKNYSCKYCGKKYMHETSLYRHNRKCSKKGNEDVENSDNVETIKLQYELQLQKKENEMNELRIKFLEKEIEKRDETDKFHQKVIAYNSKNIDNLIQNNMRALTFLNTFYSHGPCLENFATNFKDQYAFYVNSKDVNMAYDGEKFIIDGNPVSRDEYVINLVINLYNLNTDVKFYVNKIIEYYKNDKFPELQAMWVSDKDRINYNIRLNIAGNTPRWHVDKNGLIVIEKILDPMFEFTCSILRKGLLTLKSELDEVQGNPDLMMPLIKKMASISGFIDKVNKREIQPEIMKNLASHFFFDVEKHKLLLDK